MHLIHTIKDYHSLEKEGKVALVPTMGALHEGHLSLIREAKKKATHVVVSIFVNPTQFGPTEDFAKYPRVPKEDLELCKAEGVFALFMPEESEIYPTGKETTTKVHIPDLSGLYCGKTRPIFFEGVLTVVLRLLNIIKPHYAYFGQKDFQQLVLIQKMVKDLFLEVEIIGCPIIREPNGLALSSRNRYLSEKEKEDASQIYKSLCQIKETLQKGISFEESKKKALFQLEETTSGKVEYCDYVNKETLQLVKNERHGQILIAVHLNGVRLIDNIEV